MVTRITSTQNAQYKFFRALHRKKERMRHQVYMVEGIKSVRDAAAAGKDILAVLVSETFYQTEERFWDGADTYVIPDALFPALCDTQSPQGIAAAVRMEQGRAFAPRENGLYIYCDHVADPGNLGTIIRTADAAGMDGVLLSEECVDLYSPKTVRASMGSFFHIPVWPEFTLEALLDMREAGYQLLSAALGERTMLYTDADFTKPTVVILGNEANGVRRELQTESDACVKIPMVGKAESLNVGIAGAVLMYEALRQRKKQ